jgi:hypothetical protein
MRRAFRKVVPKIGLFSLHCDNQSKIEKPVIVFLLLMEEICDAELEGKLNRFGQIRAQSGRTTQNFVEFWDFGDAVGGLRGFRGKTILNSRWSLVC